MIAWNLEQPAVQARSFGLMKRALNVEYFKGNVIWLP